MKLIELLRNNDEGDRAVSPVIGVILMVAITVILAAVIGTFVLQLGDDISRTATAGVSASGNDVTLNSLGGGADGIICSDVDLGEAADSEYTERVGQSIQCSEDADSVVAYSTSGDVENATVYTFD